MAYDYSDLDELVLAYACSIHKSQGSEYVTVWTDPSDPKAPGSVVKIPNAS